MQSKPTWLNAFEVFNHVGIFFAFGEDGFRCSSPLQTWQSKLLKRQLLSSSNGQVTAPDSVSVVLSGETLVVTLYGALSPVEQAAARNPDGAARVQEFHRQLFLNASDTLKEEIRRITGIEVREAAAEVEPTISAVAHVFTSGTMVQIFLLAGKVPSDSFSFGEKA